VCFVGWCVCISSGLITLVVLPCFKVRGGGPSVRPSPLFFRRKCREIVSSVSAVVTGAIGRNDRREIQIQCQSRSLFACFFFKLCLGNDLFVVQISLTERVGY